LALGVAVLFTLIVDDVVAIDVVFCFFLLVVLLYWLDNAVESKLFPFEEGVCNCAAVGYDVTPDGGGGFRKAFMGEEVAYSFVD
jgi:hypothetical protein